jgi:hypothetical protein
VKTIFLAAMNVKALVHESAGRQERNSNQQLEIPQYSKLSNRLTSFQETWPL